MKFLNFIKKSGACSKEAFIASESDGVLDAGHGRGSHREVYTEQFSKHHADKRDLYLREGVRSLQELLNEGKHEAFELALSRFPKADLEGFHSWAEANDEREYRNLSQLLGINLGYYQGRPDLLQIDIYRTR